MSRSSIQVALPPSVEVDVDQADLLSYWRARAEQHISDVYAGVTLQKLPEDLRTYEHLLWDSRADTVVEFGTCWGGSALWFRDRLRTLRAYGRIDRPGHVISIDIDQSHARPALATADPDFAEEIDLVEADVTDPGVPSRIEEMLRPGARCLVVEDSAHTAETTAAALRGFARFVPKGGYLVVEDGAVDVESMRTAVDLPRGVLPALEEWLATPAAAGFERRRDLELYGLTGNPRGYLQRGGDAPRAPEREVLRVAARPVERSRDEHPGRALANAERDAESALERLRATSTALLDANQSLAQIPLLEHRIDELRGEAEWLVNERASLQDELARLQAEIARLGEESNAHRVRADALAASRSWQLLAPLRRLRRMAGRR